LGCKTILTLEFAAIASIVLIEQRKTEAEKVTYL
jgi:hypothetical protein